MSYSRLLSGCAAIVLVAGAADAATLTCAQYRDRLNGAMLATADKTVQVAAFTTGFESPTRGTRYDWSAAGLQGTMSCGTADQFEEFAISLAFEKKETFAATLSRFVAVAGASICALSRDGASLCADAGRAMLQSGLEQMGRAYNRGSRSPSGLVDRDLFDGAKAELTSAPSLITFLIGPGRGSSMDEARQALAGPDAKATPDKAADKP